MNEKNEKGEECERQNLSERVDKRIRGVWECETKRMTVRENLCVRQSVCESERGRDGAFEEASPSVGM